jgi:ubiquinone/menaquinone biosynthesis C-methylase UbiE
MTNQPMYADWYGRMFSASWIEHVADALPDEQTDREIAYLIDELGMGRGSCVLDLACGTGRHSIRLMLRGIPAIGVDFSVECLRRAHTQATSAALPGNFARGDLLALPFRSEMFTHALCLFTSFGYFESRREDEIVAAEAARCLRPNGNVVVDVVNPILPMCNPRRRTWSPSADGRGYMLEESHYDALSGRSASCRRVIRNNTVVTEFRQSIRIYSLAELNQLLTNAGFVVEAWRGDLTGSIYCPEMSPRLVLLARRLATGAARS